MTEAELKEGGSFVEDVFLGKILPVLFFGTFLVALSSKVRINVNWVLAFGFDRTHALELVHDLLSLPFFFGMTYLYLLRPRPLGRREGFFPKFAAFVGTFSMMLSKSVAGPLTTSDAVLFGSVVLEAVGIAVTLTALSTLRRNFSIFPEARGLVTTGIYRFVRHPMYFGEILFSSAVVLPVFSIAGAGLVVVTILFLFIRTTYEEEIVTRFHPDYAAYRARTRWRLIPGLL